MLPDDAMKQLAAFKTTIVRKKKVRRVQREGPSTVVEAKPVPTPTPVNPNVRRNGHKSWLVMVPTAAATRGLKSREDPIVKDSPITQAPYNVSHVTGITARICNDAGLFKRSRK